MTDPGTLALAIGPAMVTGTVGYAGARLQAKTAQAGVRAEVEQLRMQQRDEMRRQRQKAYHEFLTLLHRLDAEVSDLTDPPLSKESFSQWINDFNYQYGGIDLFGTDEARKQAKKVWKVVADIGKEARVETAAAEEFLQEFSKAYKQHRSALGSATSGMTETMREDVLLDISDH